MSLYIIASLSNEDKIKLEKPLSIFKNNADGGTIEDSSALHITIREAYKDDNNHSLAISVLQEFEKIKFHKFQVAINKFCRFEDNQVDWLGMDNSFPLYQIKKSLDDIAIKLGYQFMNENFNGYTPHITIGFNNTVNKNALVDFKPIPITVDNICLFGYDNEVNHVHVSDMLYRVNLI